MKHISMAVADKLYTCATSGSVHKHKVYHTAFNEFCTMINKLEHVLEEDTQDDYWQNLLRELKRYRFLLNTSPLPLNSYTTSLLSYVEDSLKKCHYSFPKSSHLVQEVFNKLFILSGLQDNPLLEAIIGLVSEQGHTALLIKEPSLLPIVETELGKYPTLRHIELVNIHQLRGAQHYQSLFVVGHSRLYPEYVLNSPRAIDIHLIRYSWLSDIWKPKSIFLQLYMQSNGINDKVAEDVRTQYEGQQLHSYKDIETDIFFEINWDHVTKKIVTQVQEDTNQEQILARLYLLANEQSVFLDSNGSTKGYVLDLEGDEDEDEELHQVKHIELSKVRPGMFLILRTEGGGEYIIPIADKILGEKAVQLRAKQEHWKILLREAVLKRGITDVSIELLYEDANRANEINVRNWMSNKTIRPQDDKDFRAILGLVGLQDKEQEYLNAAEQIESAHRKAGFYIRDQLLKRVVDADIQELHKKGFLDFELPASGGGDGGSLTALRIEHISLEVFSVPVSRLGHLIKIKDK